MNQSITYKKSSPIAVITTPKHLLANVASKCYRTRLTIWEEDCILGHLSQLARLTLASIKYHGREASQKLHIHSQVPAIRSKAEVDTGYKTLQYWVGFFPPLLKACSTTETHQHPNFTQTFLPGHCLTHCCWPLQHTTGYCSASQEQVAVEVQAGKAFK